MAFVTRPVRKNPRASCCAAAVIVNENGTYPGVCESLSVGGAFVRCETQPDATELLVVLCLPSLGPIEVAGEVLYRMPQGCGIRFTRVAAEVHREIGIFVGATM